MIWRIDLSVFSNMFIDIEAESPQEAVDLIYEDIEESEWHLIKINSVDMVQ